MGVDQLFQLTRHSHGGNPHYQWLTHWQEKKGHLFLAIQDLEQLVDQCRAARQEAAPLVQDGYKFDARPSRRLAFSIEGIANMLYGMSDIAGKVASQCSQRAGYAKTLSDSFHDIIKKIERGHYMDLEHASILPDFVWYRKLREIRTELAHHSTVFVAGTKDSYSPSLVIYSLRRPSDRKEFQEKIVMTVAEFKALVVRAITTLEAFADFLAYQFVIPGLDLEQQVKEFVTDEYGFPVIKEGRLVMKDDPLPMWIYVMKSCGYKCTPPHADG